MRNAFEFFFFFKIIEIFKEKDTVEIKVKIRELLKDFMSLVYPELCFCCGKPLMKGENSICFDCFISIPRTNFHKIEDNPVEKIFWGRVMIENATSYFTYQKGSNYQKLIHKLKYKGHRNIGVEMGKNLGFELSKDGYFDDVDIVVPVPLHPKKEKKRGYNQSQAIAEGLSFAIRRPIDNKNLYRKQYTQSQTRKGRFERWENVNEIFEVRSLDVFKDKHVLLVDDVITTGSTLEACSNSVLKSSGSKVSVATLAYAST